MEDRPGEPWGIYCRISYVRRNSDGKVETFGVDRQKPPCEALVHRWGGVVHHVYVDNDISAFNAKRRDDFEDLLADAKAGVIKGIAAFDIDRLSRDPDRDNARIIELGEHHGVTIALYTGPVDLTTSSGRYQFRMETARARRESEQKSERMLLLHDQLATKGQPHGGERSFGYEKDGVTLVQDEAALIKEARDRLLAGDSTSKIMRDWRQRGVIGVRGRPMNATSFKRIMLSPRIAGLRQHRGEIIRDATWKQIITPKDRTRLQAILEAPERVRGGRPREYVFSGLLECSHCKGQMVGASKGKGLPTYACYDRPHGGCRKTFVSAPAFESFMVPIVLDLLSNMEVYKELVARKGDSKREASLWSQLQEDEKELEELASLKGRRNPETGRPYFTIREWLAAKAPIEQRIAQANAELKQVTRSRSGLLALSGDENPTGAWIKAKGDVETRRMLVKAVIDKVIIKPGRRGGPGFDSNRAEVIPVKALTTKAGVRRVVEAIIEAHQRHPRP